MNSRRAFSKVNFNWEQEQNKNNYLNKEYIAIIFFIYKLKLNLFSI